MSERKETGSFDINPFSVTFQRHVMRYNEYNVGRLIYIHGQPDNDLVVLKSGSAEIYRDTYSGRRVVYGRLHAPWVLTNGEASGVHSTSAIALTPSLTISIDKQHLPYVLRENPQFAMWILQINQASLSLGYDTFESVATRTINQRCAYYLLENARGIRDSSGNVISYTVDRIPQQQVADAIGARRESVSKGLGQLSLRGIIRKDRRSYTFTDREKLQNIAEGNT